MQKKIDLRSDTVTQPTPEMRQAMANAIVGDDMMQEDPTVNELERLSAQTAGKEAAIFVPSGVFGNQLAILTHCNRGNEIIISSHAHVIEHEAGAAAIIAGINTRTINTQKQWFSWTEIKDHIRTEKNMHYPKTGMIEIQNTLSNGDIFPIEKMKEIYENAQKYKIPIHLDGARIFNAATALKINVKEITKYADSIMFCLSKGLSAPIGSMLVGSKKFIEKARNNRKIMGGAMRQVGIIAAAGIIAIKKMTSRLETDHKNARKLAEELAKYNKIFDINLHTVKTNMVFVKLKIKPANNFLEILKKHQILTYPPEHGYYRFVTHKDINSEDIKYFANKLPEIIEKLKNS